jgi:hypothetical protein
MKTKPVISDKTLLVAVSLMTLVFLVLFVYLWLKQLNVI